MNAKDLIEYGQQNDLNINFRDHNRTGLEWELGNGDNIYFPNWDRGGGWGNGEIPDPTEDPTGGGTTTGEGQGGDYPKAEPEPDPKPEKKSNKLLLLAAAVIGIYNAIG